MHHFRILQSSLDLFLIITIFILFEIPLALCDDDFHYSNCNSSFDCGDHKGLSYPFWGNGRPDYCGHPGFHLNCQIDKVTTQIDSGSKNPTGITYKVLYINPKSEILGISRLDFLDDLCPTEYYNTTLNFSLYNYASGYKNVTLLYGCPVANATTRNNYFSASDEIPVTGCRANIFIPVNESEIASLGNQSLLLSVIQRGFEVKWVVNNEKCSQCVKSRGVCGFDNSTNDFTCFCRDRPYSEKCSSGDFAPPFAPPGNEGNKIFLIVLISVVGTCIVAMLAICYCFRRKFYPYLIFRKKETQSGKKLEAFLKTFGAIVPKRYSYTQVKKMTNSFKEKLGQGGYGSVFKGSLLDGHPVAVKVLSDSKGNGEEFINEVASISRTSHVNIVTLLGFCIEGTKRALIYEFMSNGSLEKFIYDRNSMEPHSYIEWERLYQIVVGIAQGLEYLHRGCNTRIVHFDIKPHNILLDKDFCPKISDFGLAKICERKESIMSMTGARGTIGYIAPEVFSRNFGGVSHKSDVYSFGMMVLEIVGGRKNIDVGVDHTSEIYFPHWIYKRIELDEELNLHEVVTKEDEEVTKKMILVGLWCIQTNPSDRPSMNKVLEMLEGSIESLQIPPKPYLSSSPRGGTSSSTT